NYFCGLVVVRQWGRGAHRRDERRRGGGHGWAELAKGHGVVNDLTCYGHWLDGESPRACSPCDVPNRVDLPAPVGGRARHQQERRGVVPDVVVAPQLDVRPHARG